MSLGIEKKILLLDKVCRYPSFVIYHAYRHLAPSLLKIYFKFRTKKKVTFFIRQGLTRSHKNFNFIFSDLDLGCILYNIDDTTFIHEYYKLKKWLVFLGEVEIYDDDELKEMSKLDTRFIELYHEVRKIRQLNWIRRSLVNGRDRFVYHRIKDLRKYYILKKNIAITSKKNKYVRLEEILLSLAPVNFSLFVEYDSNVKDIFCDYLSDKVMLDKHNWNRMLFILACLPTHTRPNKIFNSYIHDTRRQFQSVNDIFLALNRIEYITAKSFIRAVKTKENWHERWLNMLSLKKVESKDVMGN